MVVPQRADIAWLNGHRPIIAQRRLRLVLLADTSMTLELASGAPDFFDWISHVVEAPERVPEHRLSSLRALANAPGVWVDPEAEVSLLVDRAWGGSVRVIESRLDYPDLVEVLRGSEPVLARVANPIELRLACAESKRRGRVVGVGPVPGWPRLEAPFERLSALEIHAGYPELVAAVDAEPDALRLAETLFTRIDPRDLETMARSEPDGGAALARVAHAEGLLSMELVARWRGPTPGLRVFGHSAEATAEREKIGGWEPTRLAKEDESGWATWADAQAAPVDLEAQPQRPGRIFAVEAELRCGVDDEERWAALAELAGEMGELRVAEVWARRALRSGTKAAATELASVLVLSGRWDEAEAVLGEALGPDGALPTRIEEADVELFEQRGLLLMGRGRLEEALAVFEALLTLHRERSEPHPKKLASYIHNVTHARLGLGEGGEELEERLREVLALEAEVLGTEDPSYATSLQTMASLLVRERRLDEAERLLRRALAIFSLTRGAGHAQTALVLEELGSLLVEQGRPVEARPLLSSALATYQRLENRVRTPGVLIRLSQALRQAGDLDGASHCAARAVAILEGEEGRTSEVPLARALTELASVYFMQRRLHDAEQLFSTADGILARTPGHLHERVLASRGLGTILTSLGRQEEAEEVLQRALSLLKSLPTPDSATEALVNEQLAGAIRQRRPREAEQLSRRSLAIQEALYGENFPHLILSRVNLAVLVGEQGRLEEAEALLEEALRAARSGRAGGAATLTEAMAAARLAETRRRLKRASARETGREARRILSTILPADHPEIANLAWSETP